MSMTVAELIERLQDMDPEAEVRLATQPSWPLQSTVRGVASQAEVDEARFDEERCDEHGFYNCDECLDAANADAPNIVWIAEGVGTDERYAPKAVFDVASI